MFFSLQWNHVFLYVDFFSNIQPIAYKYMVLLFYYN